jgi:L-threonylcarbamoyladenylate synthase
VKTIKIDKRKISAQEIGLIVDFLRKGKVVAYPTDTIYGLGCSAFSKKAATKIYRLKGRENNKALLVLISDFKMLRRFFAVNKKQLVYLHKVWPGKVSVILNKKDALPEYISAGMSSAAVRLPKNVFLTKMIRELDAPLVSTSLNKSGEKPCENINDLQNDFVKRLPDLAVDSGKISGKPSRLIDLRDPEKIKILRK